MTRVQIPAYSDRWMRGDRFGDLIKVTKAKRKSLGARAALLTIDRYGDSIEIAHVRLDKSGTVGRYIYADCTVYS